MSPHQPTSRPTGHGGTPSDTGAVRDTDRRGYVPADERAFLSDGFGARLRALRTVAGLTQEQASKLAGLNRVSLSRLEGGVCRPTMDSITALAAVLDPLTARSTAAELRKLAGKSVRTSHRRRSPRRKAITVSQAEQELRQARRLRDDAARNKYGMPASVAARETELLQAVVAAAEDNLARAMALVDVATRVHKHREGE